MNYAKFLQHTHIYGVWSKSLLTETVFTEREMNSEWNINFKIIPLAFNDENTYFDRMWKFAIVFLYLHI